MKTTTLAISILLVTASAFGQRTVTVNTFDALNYPTATRFWNSNFLSLAYVALSNSVVASNGIAVSYDVSNRKLLVSADVTSVFSRTGAVTAAAGDYSAFYQGTNSILTLLQALPYTAGDLTIASNTQPVRLPHPGANGKVLTSTNTPAGGLMWMDPPSAGGSGTVTSVGATSTVSGLQFSGVPITSSGTAILTGIVGVASGGTDATTAAGARTNLGVVVGVDVQGYDSNLANLASAGSTGTGPFVRATNSSMAIGTLTVTTNATLTNATLNGTTTLASSTNTGTMGVSGALTVGSTNIALAIAGKANSATTLSGYGITDAEPLNSNKYQATNANLTTLASSGYTGSAGAIARATGPTFGGTATFSATTNTSTAGFASGVIVGTTNVAGALALKAPLTSAALVTPTLTNATHNGSMTIQMTERQPHASVTNYVADPTVAGYQLIYATNLVTKFLHLTNAAAGLQTTFFVIAGTNATVSVELPSSYLWACNTNKVSISANQILPIAITCYGSNNTNVMASMGQPLSRLP